MPTYIVGKRLFKRISKCYSKSEYDEFESVSRFIMTFIN